MKAGRSLGMNGPKATISVLSKIQDHPHSNGLRPIGQDNVTSIWCMVVPRTRGQMRLRGVQ